MTKFHPSQSCAKCGSISRDVEFITGARVGEAEDMLRVTCRGCGFHTYFATMDTPDPAPGLSVPMLQMMWDNTNVRR